MTECEKLGYKVGDRVTISNIKCGVLNESYKDGDIAILKYQHWGGWHAIFEKDNGEWCIGGDNCDFELISEARQYVNEVVEDLVNHPPHYTQGDIECIDAIHSALGDEGFIAFCRGNAMKYTWRAGLKGDRQKCLSKAQWYINKIKEVLND